MSVDLQRAYAVAQEYNETLKATDPRFNSCVQIIHEEGTVLWFRNAFLMTWKDPSVIPDPDNAAIRQGEWLMVFTEHQGTHIFSYDDLLDWGQYTHSPLEPEEII